MNGLLVDSAVLASPVLAGLTAEAVREKALAYIGRLADISLFRTNCQTFSLWRTSDLVDILSSCDRLPLHHVLREIIELGHLGDEFQLEDVSTVANSLMFRSLPLEEVGPIRDVVLRDVGIENDPMSNRPEACSLQLCRLLALGLRAIGQNGAFHGNVFLASCAPAPEADLAVECNFTIELVESSDGIVQEVEEQVSATVSNFRSADELAKSLNFALLLASGTESSFLDACAFQAGAELDDLWSFLANERRKLFLGKQFLRSAQEHGFLHNPNRVSRLLRVCTDLLHDRNLGDSHWLREGLGANEPQRSRGDWKAWRHDIDYEYHLHYWRRGSEVELANVVVHNDFGITR